MKIVTGIPDLRAAIGARRRGGDRIGFVPTMGALHAGHLALVESARERTGFVVVSIFVNPRQFGPAEDFSRYPRDLAGDARLLESAGTSLLFAPGIEEMYPPGFSTTVHVSGVSEGMEGARRPGHFEGVATVVTRLFCLVLPDVAVFGQKDGQQLAVVKRLTADLGLPIEIVEGETVREADGLALSSRNRYLSEQNRDKAPLLYQALSLGKETWEKGERRAERILEIVARRVGEEPLFKLDALDLVSLETMQPLSLIDQPAMLAVAAFLGSTRLIDNVRLV